VALDLMRIIAGIAKGRSLVVPPGSRPMTARAREGIFSSLGRAVAGARVLDLFAGSGSLGLEALSRGAASAVFVEQAVPGALAIQRNVAITGLGGEVIRSKVLNYLKHPGGLEAQFDLAFVDPPYSDSLASIEEVMQQLEPRLADGATVVVRRRAGGEPPLLPTSYVMVDRRRYGDDEVFRYLERVA